jgi:hypothetical protein
MGWTADAPVIAQHEVKAPREMVGSSYDGRLNLARSSSSMSNLPWSTAPDQMAEILSSRSMRNMVGEFQPVRRDAPGQ